MRSIKNCEWEETIINQEGKSEVRKISLTEAITILLNSQNSQNMPRGFDQFRIFNRINKSFDSAKDGGEIILEETDYSFIKKIIQESIPAAWGSRTETFEAFNSFMTAEEIKPEPKK